MTIPFCKAAVCCRIHEQEANYLHLKKYRRTKKATLLKCVDLNNHFSNLYLEQSRLLQGFNDFFLLFADRNTPLNECHISL